MDISAIPMVKKLSHLPIIADPSHGTGRRDQVLPMARAAVAAGADGLLVEVHHDPDNALSRWRAIAAAGAVHGIDEPVPHHRVGRGPNGLEDGRTMESVAIVGVGLIGGSFGLALRAAGFADESWASVPPTTIEQADRARRDRCRSRLWKKPQRRAISSISRNRSPRSNARSSRSEASHRPDCLVTDAGSTKVRSCEQLREDIRHAQFLGGHPMAGKESRGVASAAADLFRRSAVYSDTVTGTPISIHLSQVCS